MKKSRLVRWGIALLVLVTLLARPVQTALTPKVNFTTAKDGAVAFTLYGRDLHWHAQERQEVGIDVKISGALYIEEIFVREREQVENGQALLRFQPAKAQETLYAAQRSLFECNRALAQLDDSVRSEMLEIEERLRQSDISNEERGILAGRLQRLDGEYQQERLFLVHDRDAAQAEVDALLSLQQNDWQLFSPCAGFVGAINGANETAYDGEEPIVTVYIPGENVLLTAEVTADDNFENYTLRATLEGEKQKIDRLAVTYTLESGTALCTVEVPYEEARKVWDGANLAIECSDSTDRIAIPVGALVNGDSAVYVITEKSGLWGVEYVLEQRTILTGTSNGRYIAVRSGLMVGDKVVLMSDRPVSPGDRVLLN